jgi:hypothetical protein
MNGAAGRAITNATTVKALLSPVATATVHIAKTVAA